MGILDRLTGAKRRADEALSKQLAEDESRLEDEADRDAALLGEKEEELKRLRKLVESRKALADREREVRDLEAETTTLGRVSRVAGAAVEAARRGIKKS